MQFSPLTALCVMTLTFASAPARGSGEGAARPYPQRLPFEQGDMELKIGFGYASGDGGSAYLLRGAFSYYVLPGFAPGLDVVHQGGSYAGADQTWVLVPVKWVLYRSRGFSPYVVAEGGRIIRYDAGFPDLWIAGAGPGVHVLSSGGFGFFAEMIVYRLFPSDTCDDCWGRQLGFGVSFLL